MKFNFTNILLFSLSLNILLLASQVYIQRNHYNILHISNTKPIKSHRSLCECDIYTSIYGDNSEMKAVMQEFDRQTTQRFEEFNKRINDKRQKCKDQCHKDIQKIILKDKIEKELTEKLATLETNITTKDISTCVCKKSLADKTENFCLNCGYGLGGSVLQSLGLFGGSGLYAWNIGATAAAKKAAAEAGAAAGLKAGHAAGAAKVITEVEAKFHVSTLGSQTLKNFFTATNYMNENLISEAVNNQFVRTCVYYGVVPDPKGMCPFFESLPVGSNGTVTAEEYIVPTVKQIVTQAKTIANAKASSVTTTQTAALKAKNMAAVRAGFDSYITAVNASITAILIIVLIMVIIYLILRYRRKKKMKKKLQYIKLLKE